MCLHHWGCAAVYSTMVYSSIVLNRSPGCLEARGKNSGTMKGAAKKHKAIYIVYARQICLRLTLSKLPMNSNLGSSPRAELAYKSGTYCIQNVAKGIFDFSPGIPMAPCLSKAKRTDDPHCQVAQHTHSHSHLQTHSCERGG